MFVAATRSRLQALRRIPSSTFDARASRGALGAIGLAGFGFDFNSIAQPDSELVRKYRTVFHPGKSAARIRILANVVPIDQTAVQLADEEQS